MVTYYFFKWQSTNNSTNYAHTVVVVKDGATHPAHWKMSMRGRGYENEIKLCNKNERVAFNRSLPPLARISSFQSGHTLMRSERCAGGAEECRPKRRNALLQV